MKRQIKRDIIKAIQSGKILQCVKIKHVTGKRTITLGPYQTAVPSNKAYAMFIDNEPYYYSLAVDATDDFIEYVGRDIAYEAMKEANRQ